MARVRVRVRVRVLVLVLVLVATPSAKRSDGKLRWTLLRLEPDR